MMTDYRPEIAGQVVRSLRLRKGLSQEVLSGLADMERTHLNAIEKGKKVPTFGTLWKLALALGMLPHQLVLAIESRMEQEECRVAEGSRGFPEEEKEK